jgi:RNA polymerase sigma factor (sigma-70 family)
VNSIKPDELVSLVRAGDDSAEEELLRRYQAGVTAILRATLVDHSLIEEIRQEAFAIVLRKIREGALRDPERLTGFIVAVAHQLCKDHLRRVLKLEQAIHHTSRTEDQLISAPLNPDEMLMPSERAELVRQVLSEMKSTRNRAVLLRFFIGEEDKGTICNDLGLTGHQFNLILWRAKEQYKRLYQKALIRMNEGRADASIMENQAQSVTTISLELTIDMPYISFTTEDEEGIVAALKELLDQSTPIRIVTVRPGSTKITIEITYKQAEQLLWLYRRGLLRELNVTDAQLIGNATAAAVIRHKTQERAFDVFLCHNSADRPEVKRIALELHRYGLLPWLDEWELRPGLPWQNILEEQMEMIKSAAVFVGDSGIGPWQDLELNAFLRQFVLRKCPVIPVILRGCRRIPHLPPFLDGMTWVNFGKRKPAPIQQLVWGITGERFDGDYYR